jgi:hypothetical protein
LLCTTPLPAAPTIIAAMASDLLHTRRAHAVPPRFSLVMLAKSEHPGPQEGSALSAKKAASCSKLMLAA